MIRPPSSDKESEKHADAPKTKADNQGQQDELVERVCEVENVPNETPAARERSHQQRPENNRKGQIPRQSFESEFHALGMVAFVSPER
jgi:hypothetical protein